MKDVNTLTYTEEKGGKTEKAIEARNQKPKEEEFECLDHGHFIMEYDKLLKRAEDIEFNIRSLLNLKRNSSQWDESYQLITLIKYELDLKLKFLAKDQKIDAKQLVEDVHHFNETLKNFSLKPSMKTDKYIDYYDECNDDYYEGYDDEYHMYVVGDEDDCYGLDIKGAKKTKKKNSKNKKKGTTNNGSNSTLMLH